MKANPTRLVIFLFCIMALGASLTAIYYFQFHLLEYREVGADFRIVEREIGLNTDPDALHFGHVPRGGNSQRYMIVTPVNDAMLRIRFSDEIAHYLWVDKSDFLVEGGVPINLTFEVRPDPEMEFGDYNGTVKFYFFRP